MTLDERVARSLLGQSLIKGVGEPAGNDHATTLGTVVADGGDSSSEALPIAIKFVRVEKK